MSINTLYYDHEMCELHDDPDNNDTPDTNDVPGTRNVRHSYEEYHYDDILGNRQHTNTINLESMNLFELDFKEKRKDVEIYSIEMPDSLSPDEIGKIYTSLIDFIVVIHNVDSSNKCKIKEEICMLSMNFNLSSQKNLKIKQNGIIALINHNVYFQNNSAVIRFTVNNFPLMFGFRYEFYLAHNNINATKHTLQNEILIYSSKKTIYVNYTNYNNSLFSADSMNSVNPESQNIRGNSLKFSHHNNDTITINEKTLGENNPVTFDTIWGADEAIIVVNSYKKYNFTFEKITITFRHLSMDLSKSKKDIITITRKDFDTIFNSSTDTMSDTVALSDCLYKRLQFTIPKTHRNTKIHIAVYGKFNKSPESSGHSWGHGIFIGNNTQMPVQEINSNSNFNRMFADTKIINDSFMTVDVHFISNNAQIVPLTKQLSNIAGLNHNDYEIINTSTNVAPGEIKYTNKVENLMATLDL